MHFLIVDDAEHDAAEAIVRQQRCERAAIEVGIDQGLGSQIELTDAQTAVTTAEGNLVSAEFQLADAWEQLRRALGQI